jgi:hypothetical protein
MPFAFEKLLAYQKAIDFTNQAAPRREVFRRATIFCRTTEPRGPLDRGQDLEEGNLDYEIGRNKPVSANLAVDSEL